MRSLRDIATDLLLVGLERPSRHYDALLRGDTVRLLSRFDTVSSGRAVNLLLPHAIPSQTFAGVKTALLFGEQLAKFMALPLRVVPFRDDLAQLMRSALRVRQHNTRITAIRDLCPGTNDVWIATYWSTAAALQTACQMRKLSPDKVVYFVQDYEPGFFPWSSDKAFAKATYHAGFRLVVNSEPLARYLREQEGIAIEEQLIVRPTLNHALLREAAGKRRAARYPRIFFYARPTKPRNLFELGAQALEIFSRAAVRESEQIVIVTAGERHKPLVVAPNTRIVQLGNVGWHDYYHLIAETDIALSLMYSPHPSHPPLDFAAGGARVVTNAMNDFRSNLHDNIVAATPAPEALADALLSSMRDWRQQPLLPFAPPRFLGSDMASVASAVASQLCERSAGGA